MTYPYDPQIRARLAQALYEHLPAWYRAEDDPPRGRGDLAAFLAILAAPLATLRQNIEELHGDLFIDTASDRALGLLAQMVGTTPIFSDPAANRADIRGTVAWRRRKGTPRALEELAEAIAEQLVVTLEGFERVQITQEIRYPYLLRPGRVVPDVRDPTLAGTSEGPLDVRHHCVDLRAISRTTGRYHPKHIIHWLHPTHMFPMRGATPTDLSKSDSPDHRFAVLTGFPADRRELERPLRAARAGAADTLLTDRIPPTSFREAPGDWFGRQGRFSIRIAGLLAAVAAPETGRSAERRAADPVLIDTMAGALHIHVLAFDNRRQRGSVRFTVASVTAPDPGNAADVTTIESLTSVVIEEGTAAGASITSGPSGSPGAGRLAMLKLEPVTPGLTRLGALTLELRSQAPEADRASAVDELARDGFLRGALHVQLHEQLLDGSVYYYLAADGSLFRGQTSDPDSAVDIPVEDVAGALAFAPETLASTGPGSAWPALAASADPRPLREVPTAPGAGPAILHAGVVRDNAGTALTTEACALELAVRYRVNGEDRVEPFLRLEWIGSDPHTAATWIPLDSSGRLVDAGHDEDVDERWREIAGLREQPSLELIIRLVSEVDSAVLPPSELAYMGYDGRARLIYLPELTCSPGTSTVNWEVSAGYSGASEAVWVGEDGATFQDQSVSVRRRAFGAIAPLPGPTALRRRQLGHRRLCPWHNETATDKHQATPSGWLHVDVEHGLFAFSDADPLPVWPVNPGAAAPPVVTVDYQHGFTTHVGARPAPRAVELDELLPRPTRIVCRSGLLEPDAAPDLHEIPRYSTLSAALAAIASSSSPKPEEVVRFQDSATYPGEVLSWPTGVRRLRLHAAPGTRPLIELVPPVDPVAAPVLDMLELIGLAIESEIPVVLPPAARSRLAFISVHPTQPLEFSPGPDGRVADIDIVRSTLGPLVLTGAGRVQVQDSLVDGGDAGALDAKDAHITLERCTARGAVEVGVLDASDSLIDGSVQVVDRFRGCVRFSRVDSGSVLPRQHRVIHDSPRFVSLDPRDPAYLRLHERTPVAITRGSEDGSEIGAFSSRKISERLEGLSRRLAEHTPAGLVTGVIRLD